MSYAVLQSVTEILLGSIVHAFRIPLGGHLLSMNQAVLLTLAVRKVGGRRPAAKEALRMATTAALLKSLSPLGSRVTPMLAISVQGLLFSVGLLLFGPGGLGIAAGAALLAVWGFAQPLLIAYLVFGKVFFDGVVKLWSEIAGVLAIPAEAGMRALWAVVIAKSFLSALLSVWAWRAGYEFEARYVGTLERWSRRVRLRGKQGEDRGAGSPFRGALRDFSSRPFILAFVFSVACFAASGKPEAGRVVIYAARVGGTGFLLFWAFRAVPRAWIERALSRFPQIRASVDQALEKLSRT